MLSTDCGSGVDFLRSHGKSFSPSTNPPGPRQILDKSSTNPPSLAFLSRAFTSFGSHIQPLGEETIFGLLWLGQK